MISKYRVLSYNYFSTIEYIDANLAEAAKREAKWCEANYYIISMKNDFKTIYGANVQKVDFAFPKQ